MQSLIVFYYCENAVQEKCKKGFFLEFMFVENLIKIIKQLTVT